jgi:hypothetical protein
MTIIVTINQDLPMANVRADYARGEIPSHLQAAATHPANREQPGSVACIVQTAQLANDIPFEVLLRPSRDETDEMDVICGSIVVACEVAEFITTCSDEDVDALVASGHV